MLATCLHQVFYIARPEGRNQWMKIPIYPASPIKSFEDKFSKGEVYIPPLAKGGWGDFK